MAKTRGFMAMACISLEYLNENIYCVYKCAVSAEITHLSTEYDYQSPNRIVCCGCGKR